MRHVDIEFKDLLGDAQEACADDFFRDADEPDLFLKTLADCEFSIDRSALDSSLADVHTRLDEHYRKIGQGVTAPAPKPAGDELQKIARRLAPQVQGPVRIEEEISESGTRVRKTFNAKTNALLRVQLLESGDA